MLLFRLLFTKNVKLWLKFTWMLWFPHTKYNDRNPSALRICDRDFFSKT